MIEVNKIFSIITVNYNGEKFLDKFLSSLVNQTFKGFNLFFVDNGSKDNSLKIVEEYMNLIDIKIITLDKNYGFAKANNLGIDQAMSEKSDYIITLNNDIELESNCFKNLDEKIGKEKVSFDVFQMLMINYFERNIIDAAGISFDEHYFAGQIGYKEDIKNIKKFKKEIPGACAGAAVYSKKALSSVREENGDYFDSRFFAYYEDVDLALRLLNKGFRTLLISEAIVYHIHSGTGNEGSTFKAYYLSRNLYFYLRKNLKDKEYNKNKYFYNVYFVKNLMKCIIKGKFKIIGSTFKGFLDYKNKIEPTLKK